MTPLLASASQGSRAATLCLAASRPQPHGCRLCAWGSDAQCTLVAAHNCLTGSYCEVFSTQDPRCSAGHASCSEVELCEPTAAPQDIN